MRWPRRCRPFLLLLFAAFLLSPVRFGAARAYRGIVGRFQGGGTIPWQPLTWDDFRVNDAQNGLSAETVSFLRFRYATHVEKAKDSDDYTATITQITFSGGFDKTKSWRRSNIKNNPALLAHEQGHLDLNEIKRRQLQTSPLSSFPVGRGATMNDALADLSAHLGEWFRGEVFSLRTRQIQYDTETNFGTGKKGQKIWSEQIANEVAPAPPVAPVASAYPSSSPIFPKPSEAVSASKTVNNSSHQGQ